jgi:hypothetical protein
VLLLYFSKENKNLCTQLLVLILCPCVKRPDLHPEHFTIHCLFSSTFHLNLPPFLPFPNGKQKDYEKGSGRELQKEVEKKTGKELWGEAGREVDREVGWEVERENERKGGGKWEEKEGKGRDERREEESENQLEGQRQGMEQGDKKGEGNMKGSGKPEVIKVLAQNSLLS